MIVSKFQIDLAENNYPRAVEDGNIFVAHDANCGNAMPRLKKSVIPMTYF